MTETSIPNLFRIASRVCCPCPLILFKLYMFLLSEPVATILHFSSSYRQHDSVNMNDFPYLVALDILSRLWDSLGTYSVSYNLHLCWLLSDTLTFNLLSLCGNTHTPRLAFVRLVRTPLLFFTPGRVGISQVEQKIFKIKQQTKEGRKEGRGDKTWM